MCIENPVVQRKPYLNERATLMIRSFYLFIYHTVCQIKRTSRQRLSKRFARPEMPSKELSRVGCKYMAVEKQGTRQSYSVSHASSGSDIVSPAWGHAAGKTVKQLRSLAKVADEEGTHLPLFLNMWNTLQIERPELFTQELIAECKELIHLAAQQEIVWGKYIVSEGVMGLTDQIITEFVESLADKRLVSMGFSPMYGTKNPVPWFDEASSINGGETNFFEGKNASYSTGALEWE